MNPFHPKDFELNEKIKTLASQERKLTQEILEHVAEVDRRKLYLAMSYPSLFEYLVREAGYSEGSAQRRIDAARLLQRVPEISNQIQSGSICLSQISKLQRVCRQVKKTSGSAVHLTVQKEVLAKLQNQGARQTDLILAQEFNVEIAVHEKKQIQRDESIRLEVTFSKAEMEVIEKAQAILSHKTGGNLKATLLEMAHKIIKDHEPKTDLAATVAAEVPVKGKPMVPVAERVTMTQAERIAKLDKVDKTKKTQKAATKTLTPKLRKEILHRDQSCQYMAEKSGKLCGSKYFLEVDHLHPRFADGNNKAKNLRILCSAHNKFRYNRETRDPMFRNKCSNLKSWNFK